MFGLIKFIINSVMHVPAYRVIRNTGLNVCINFSFQFQCNLYSTGPTHRNINSVFLEERIHCIVLSIPDGGSRSHPLASLFIVWFDFYEFPKV